jgi:hypothetical protein
MGRSICRRSALNVDNGGIDRPHSSRRFDPKGGVVGKGLTKRGDLAGGVGLDPHLSRRAAVVSAEPPERLPVGVGVSSQKRRNRLTPIASRASCHVSSVPTRQQVTPSTKTGFGPVAGVSPVSTGESVVGGGSIDAPSAVVAAVAHD